MAHDHPPPRGGPSHQSVGRYRIESHIASGGMGAVYLAFDPDLNRTVAPKVLSPEMAAKPNMVQRFQREAKAAAKLKHEHIVQIFDFGEVAGTFYLALEYIDGTDLQDYIEQRPGGRLEVDEAIFITIQAAKALDHAFSKGIVHRDIKPSNFLVTTRAGKLFIKLTDMGLAREADDSRITRDNTTLGTVDYISPEQARDSGSADVRSDLYSLGCTLFHMLVGHGPFPKGTLIEKVQHHLHTPAPDIRSHRADVSDFLADVLFKLLAKEPDDRYETPLHLLHDLMPPTDFEEYLKSTKELERPEFKPPTRHVRTTEATVSLPAVDLLPPPDPLFPADFLTARPETVTEQEIEPPPPAPPPPATAPTSVPASASPMKPPAPVPEIPVRPPVPTEIKPLPTRSATAPSAGRVEKSSIRPSPPPKPPRQIDPPPPRTKVEPKSSPSAKKKITDKIRPENTAAKERLRRRNVRRLWTSPLWIGGITGGLLFAAFSVWAMLALMRSEDPAPIKPSPVDPTLIAVKPPAKIVEGEPKPAPTPNKPIVKPLIVPPPKEELPKDVAPIVITTMGPEIPEPKRLTKLPGKIDLDAVRRDIVGPHGEFSVPADSAVVLKVSRGAAPGPGTFPFFADAWTEAARHPDAIIEVHDAGPLPVATLPPLTTTNLTLRGASGLRPILLWNRPAGDKSSAWMTLNGGSLIVENIDLLDRADVAGNVAGDALTKPRACFDVGEDALARDVTLTQVGGDRAGLALFRLTGRPTLAQVSRDGAESIAVDGTQFGRIENCCLRGSGVFLAEIDASAGDLLIHRSLLVGGDRPAVLVDGEPTDFTRLRFVRSTLISNRASVEFLPNAENALAPRIGVFSFDSLLTCPTPQNGAAMILLGESIGLTGLTTRMTHSVYAGWPTLLLARQTRLPTIDAWRTLWGHRDGDIALANFWPAALVKTPDRALSLNMTPLASPAAFVSAENDGLVGCPVGRLPADPSPMQLRIPDALPVCALGLPEAFAPTIEASGDGVYRGEVLNLAKIPDLAEYLAGKDLAPRVVLHLTGRGVFRSSPLRFSGTQVVLYSPPADGPTIEFQTLQGIPTPALIDAAGGSLELINIRVRLDWKRLSEPPQSVIRVRDGQLALAGCAFHAPLASPPTGFRSLISLESTSPAAPTRFTCRDSVLLSPNSIIALDGPGHHLRCHRNLLVAMGDGLAISPGQLAASPNVIARFDSNTVVVSQAFARVDTPRRFPSLPDPMMIHAASNYFSSPSLHGGAVMLRCNGDAVARGLLAWQGRANAYDAPAFARSIAWGEQPGTTPFPKDWDAFWGRAAETDALILPAKSPPPKAFSIDQPNFDRFILPSTIRLDVPGANLSALAPLMPAIKKK